MTSMRGIRRLAVLLAAWGLVAALAHGGENANPSAVWESFRASLRRGDYPAAYAWFSQASRRVFSQEDFNREYDPVGVACPLILSEPAETRLQRTFDDWAELHLAVRRTDGKPVRLRVTFARENDGWRLVAGRHEQEERWEMETRRWLQGAASANANAAERLQWLEARRADSGAGPSFYRLERHGGGLRAAARRTDLRSFLLTADNRIVDVDPASAASTSAPAPVSTPSPRPALPAASAATAPFAVPPAPAIPPAPAARPLFASAPAPVDHSLDGGFGISFSAPPALSGPAVPGALAALDLPATAVAVVGSASSPADAESSWAGAFPALTRQQTAAAAAVSGASTAMAK